MGPLKLLGHSKVSLRAVLDTQQNVFFGLAESQVKLQRIEYSALGEPHLSNWMSSESCSCEMCGTTQDLVGMSFPLQ